jgi:ethanolamine ammonia-lyase large subunit
MDVTLDDLDWCIDEIMPANPAYLMALPTKNDPMLSYLTTSFSNHLKVREKFGYKVNDVMWDFFKKLEIIDSNNKPGKHFGDPLWVWYNYRLLKGDTREMSVIYAEGKAAMSRVRKRGVPLAEGYGANYSDLPDDLNKEVKFLYEDAKASLWSEIDQSFVKSLSAETINTEAIDRKDYIYHPVNGESINKGSIKKLKAFREDWLANNQANVQIVISDGLNARSLMDEGHLLPFLKSLNLNLQERGFKPTQKNIFIKHGRVRAAYRCGEMLFSGSSDAKKTVLHVVGERPGNGHSTFSVYITSLRETQWKEEKTDHNVTRVVSGISNTTLLPDQAAVLVCDILQTL